MHSPGVPVCTRRNAWMKLRIRTLNISASIAARKNAERISHNCRILLPLRISIVFKFSFGLSQLIVLHRWSYLASFTANRLSHDRYCVCAQNKAFCVENWNWKHASTGMNIYFNSWNMVAEWKSNRNREMWEWQKIFFDLQRATRALPANPAIANKLVCAVVTDLFRNDD